MSRPVSSFVPCSSKHKSCSPAHAELVRDYTAERERQEGLKEKETNGYPGDEYFWNLNNKLITFKQWLISKKGQT